MKKILLSDVQYLHLKDVIDSVMEDDDSHETAELWKACADATDEEEPRSAVSAMAERVLARSSSSNADILHGVGRDADLGQDEDMMATHHDLENDDLENVDTRPKQ